MTLQQHLAAYAQGKDEAAIAPVREFLDWAASEQAKIDAEVAHLSSCGYTVTAP